MARIFLLFLLSLPLWAEYVDERIYNTLCGYFKDKQKALYYGDFSSASSFDKRISEYKFRFGIDTFDFSQCQVYNYPAYNYPSYDYPYFIAPHPHIRNHHLPKPRPFR